MKSRSCRLVVEALEDRCVPSTLAYGDFNHDGLMDVAAITSPTTIAVRLANQDGSYTTSATLTIPKNLPIGGITVDDFNSDGKLDIAAGGYTKSGFYTHTWLGNGDGTFGTRDTQKTHVPKWWV